MIMSDRNKVKQLPESSPTKPVRTKDKPYHKSKE